jgi:hypothetical protein
MTLARGLKISLVAILAVAAVPFVLTPRSMPSTTHGWMPLSSTWQPSAAPTRPAPSVGYPLYATALTGLIMLIGLPFAGVALLVWLVVAGVAMLRRRRRSARAFSGEVDTGSP